MKHRTGTGKVISISQMTDNHLTNMIRFLITRLEDVKNKLCGGISGNKFLSAVNEVEEFDDEELQDIAVKILEKLPHYIFEALLRGISVDDYMIKVSDLVERKGALKITGSKALISDEVFDENGELYLEDED